MPTAGLTSVVVVSHRSISTLGDCLGAVLASTAPVEVVVVDNGSDDGSAAAAAALAAADARVRLLANAGNPGFASASNQGAAVAEGDGLLFLNPDAFVAADTIARLRVRLAGDAAIGLLGCTVVDADGRAHGPQRRREPTWQRSLISLAGLDRWQHRWPMLEGLEQAPPKSPGSGLGQTPLSPAPAPARAGSDDAPSAPARAKPLGGSAPAVPAGPPVSRVEPSPETIGPRTIEPGATVRRGETIAAGDTTEPVDAVNGAVMLLPADLFRRLGGFDEGFRLHAEDADLCRRVRDAGRRVALAADVRVVHVGGVSGRRRPLWVEWQKTRSLWRYFRKHQPGTGWPIRFAVAVGLGLRLLLKAPLLVLRRHR